MRLFASFCRVMIWVTLVITTAVQALAIIGIYMKGSGSLFNPVLLIVAVAAMVVSVILFFALPRGKIFPLAAAALTAILFIVLAVEMTNAFPTSLSSDGGTTGISMTKAVFRHMTPALIPLLMLPVWWQYHRDRVAQNEKAATEKTPSYFDMLDKSYTMRSLEDETIPAPKPKRSVRARLRKTEDGQ